MSVFYTDFSGQTVGSNPSGWSGSMLEGTATWLIVANETTGAKELRLYIPQTAGYAENFITYDSLNSGNANARVEVLAKVRSLTDGGLATLMSRWNVNAASPTYYSGTVYMLPNYDRPAAFIRKAVAGTETDLSAVTYNSVDGAKQGWFWIRFRVDGTTLSIRTWKDGVGVVEPTGWNTVTDSSVTAAGASGVLFQRLHADYGVDYRIGWYGLATNGDTIYKPLEVQEATLGIDAENPAPDVPGSEGSVIYGGWGSFLLGSSYAGAGSAFSTAEIGAISPTMGITADNVTLIEDVQLTVQDATLGMTVDSPLPIVDIALLAQDATLGIASDNVEIDATVAVALPDEASIGITSDSPSLQQQHYLVVQDSSLGMTVDSPSFFQDYHLVPSNSTIGIDSEIPSIIQDFHLLVQDSTLGLDSDNAQVLISFSPGQIDGGEYTPRAEGTPVELQPAGAISVDQYTPQAVTSRAWEQGDGPDSGSWNSA